MDRISSFKFSRAVGVDTSQKRMPVIAVEVVSVPAMTIIAEVVIISASDTLNLLLPWDIARTKSKRGQLAVTANTYNCEYVHIRVD